MFKRLLWILLSWLSRKASKPAPEPILPTSKKRINLIDLYRLLRPVAEDAQIFLSDRDYLLCDYEDIKLFLEQDKTNRYEYEKEAYDCPGISPELGYVMGLFFADGSCGLRRGQGKRGAWWRLTNTNLGMLRGCIPALELEWNNLSFKVISFPSESCGSTTNLGERKKGLNHLEVNPKERHNDGSRGNFIDEWRKMFYFEGNKKLPAGIIDADNETKRAFLRGVIAGDGSQQGNTSYYVTSCGMIGTCGLIKLGLDVNWKVSLYEDKRHENVYTIRYNTSTEDLTKDSGCDDFAYRLMGQFSVPKWSALTFGIVWTQNHAMNCLVTENGTFRFVEPQTDKIRPLAEGEGEKIRCIMM